MQTSHPVQATLPTQHLQSSAGQRTGAGRAGPSERVGRGKATGDAAAEARTAVQQPGQQPDAAFTASSTETGERAQEIESKKCFYSASLRFGPGPHAKEAFFGPATRLTNKSRVGGVVFLKWK